MSIAKTLYERTVREALPEKLGVLNGVAVREPRLLDATDVQQDYEEALVTGLRTHVTPEDDVVVVGGGRGVSAVVAARHGNSVVAYEGTAERVRMCRETARLNRVSETVDVEHALVGPEIHVVGERGEPAAVSPSELPACDVLEMDCEGAELAILRNLEIRPRVIIVETHAHLDSPERAVRAELDRLGYEVVDRGVEVDEDGVYVLTAVCA